MTDGELDFILSRQESIAPSSGFVESVMNAVHKEAFTPQPIPFPWKRAIPGFAAVVVLLVWFCAAILRFTEESPVTIFTPQPPSGLVSLADAVIHAGTGWLLLALSLSLISVKLSMYIAAALRSQRMRRNY